MKAFSSYFTPETLKALRVALVEPVAYLRGLVNRQQHPSISLVEAQQTLKMPLVEIWIGALLSGQVKLE